MIVLLTFFKKELLNFLHCSSINKQKNHLQELKAYYFLGMVNYEKLKNYDSSIYYSDKAIALFKYFKSKNTEIEFKKFSNKVYQLKFNSIDKKSYKSTFRKYNDLENLLNQLYEVNLDINEIEFSTHIFDKFSIQSRKYIKELIEKKDTQSAEKILDVFLNDFAKSYFKKLKGENRCDAELKFYNYTSWFVNTYFNSNYNQVVELYKKAIESAKCVHGDTSVQLAYQFYRFGVLLHNNSEPFINGFQIIMIQMHVNSSEKLCPFIN